MAYKLEDTDWKFTAPQEGEVDSAEKKAETLREIDTAILTRDHRAQLESRGEEVDVETDGSFARSEYLSDLYGRDVYVTDLHMHEPTKSVPESDHSKESDHAKEADHADVASRLEPGAKINGHLFDGTEDITINIDEIPGANRVYYGTVDPSKFGGFGKLRDGDLYVKYYN